MTVFHSTMSRARPGRRHDAIAAAQVGKKLVEREGARDCRLGMATTAGEMSGTFIFTMQFDNNEDYGAFADKAALDMELSALMDRLDHEDSPTVLMSQSLGVEIPFDRPTKPGHGKVMEAYVGKALPGRFEGALDLARRTFDFVESKGAMNCHMISLLNAGMMTDALVVTWELENMRALGRLGDAYMSDPAGQEIFQMLTAADCPVTGMSSGVWQDIPL
jgi:hypothetical protein